MLRHCEEAIEKDPTKQSRGCTGLLRAEPGPDAALAMTERL